MTEISRDNFFFLNRGGRWLKFKWNGLESRKEGALQLSSLPRATVAIPDSVKTAAVPDGPAGLAMDAGGTLYFTDPSTNSVRRILGCDGAVGLVPCMGGSRSGPTSFNTPRGLLIPSNRSSLFVVDSGNHCIKIFELDTFELVGIWGQSTGSTPEPSSNPGEFDTPWTLAGDSAGNVYVVDYGNQRVQKFNALGGVVPQFSDNVLASGLLQEPVDIAVAEHNGADWIFVADRSSAAIFVFAADGNPVLDAAGNPRRIQDAHLTEPQGLAATGNSVYIGVNASSSVLRFQIADAFGYVGAALGYVGPVAALFLDGKGGLWVHSGDSLTPNKLSARAGYVTAGSLWLDPTQPLQVDHRKVQWHRLQAIGRTLPANAHLDLYAYASCDLSKPPVVDPSSTNPFSDPKWQSIGDAANLDVTELYIGRAKDNCDNQQKVECGKSKYLWVGASFSGDGTVSPELQQLRVEFDYPTYEQYLPAVYRNNANCGEFLARLLSLFESFFAGVESEIDHLPALFDPCATPKGFLMWLAGCLGLDLDDNWDETQKRRIIARIFELSGRRGTRAGLREILRLFAGVDATIEEPLLQMAWWSLPSPDSCCDECASNAGTTQAFEQTQNSRLGWTTMLASAQPQGAVVGSSAVLDQSHLISDEEFGAPLFTEVAHQFSVEVFRGQVMCPESLARVRAIINQEKPAHTSYHLCIIDPRFRVGYQSRVGIDTVVAGPPRSLALGSDQGLGFDSSLAGAPPSLLGTESHLGVSTRLG